MKKYESGNTDISCKRSHLEVTIVTECPLEMSRSRYWV